MSKILERAIRDEIVRHLVRKNLITKHQHGLLECLEDWTRNYDEGIQTDIIYLDFRKAFNTVPVQRLIFKLEKLGIRGGLLTWIEDFF